MSDDELGLFRMVQREMLAGFESIREELKRTREALERIALLHEDVFAPRWSVGTKRGQAPLGKEMK